MLLQLACFSLFPASIYDFQHCPTWLLISTCVWEWRVRRVGREARLNKRHGTGVSLWVVRRRVKIWLGVEGGRSSEVMILLIWFRLSKLKTQTEPAGTWCCLCSTTGEEDQQLIVHWSQKGSDRELSGKQGVIQSRFPSCGPVRGAFLFWLWLLWPVAFVFCSPVSGRGWGRPALPCPALSGKVWLDLAVVLCQPAEWVTLGDPGASGREVG